MRILAIFRLLRPYRQDLKKGQKFLSERVVQNLRVEVDFAVFEEAVHRPVVDQLPGGAGEHLPVGRDEPQFIGKHQRLRDVMTGQ